MSPSSADDSPSEPERPHRAWALPLMLLAAAGVLVAGWALPLTGSPVAADDAVGVIPVADGLRPLDDLESGTLDRMVIAASLPRVPASLRSGAEREDVNALIPADPPERWLTSRRRRCQRHSGRYYCDGPLRVARPHGPAAELAETLGLGTIQTAAHLLRHPPEPEWVDAVEGEAHEGLRWPVDGGNLWRGFGRVRLRTGGRRLHKGVDIGADPGTPVVAVNDAIVAYSHYEVRGYGNLVMLVHPDATTSMYAHLRAAYVFPGQQIRRGEVIGESGHTGIARGPHLHFEWRVKGRPRDPAPRFLAVPEDQLERLPRHALARRDDSQG